MNKRESLHASCANMVGERTKKESNWHVLLRKVKWMIIWSLKQEKAENNFEFPSTKISYDSKVQIKAYLLPQNYLHHFRV